MSEKLALLTRVAAIVTELADRYPGDREFSTDCIYCFQSFPQRIVDMGTRREEDILIPALHDPDCLYRRANEIKEMQ